MGEKELRKQIVETGLYLLETGLVARTWGNVSAKVNNELFLITPSGLDYLQTQEEDIALYNLKNDTYEGKYKPSSEKGIHSGAYELLDDVTFVIHTHQTYASAIGVFGFEQLEISDEERKKLGGIAEASYGLPGTEKLKNAVKDCYAKGAHTVFMKHHGVVVAGKNKEEAIERVNLLEDICKRNCKGLNEGEDPKLTYAKLNQPLYAQLDDMAQMIGRSINIAKSADAALLKKNAVIIPNQGIFVKGTDDDDTKALQLLVEKAAITALHVRANNEKRNLSFFDCILMNYVYKKKYSKQKNLKREK